MFQSLVLLRTLAGWNPMDADKVPQGEAEEQATDHYPTKQISTLSGRETTSSRSSIESQDPAANTDADADADLLASDMDGAAVGYRRRRAQLMDRLENGNAGRKKSNKERVHRHRNTSGAPNEEDKQLAYSSDESHASDFSSRTTSEDFELDHLTAEDAFSDDEEAGMTKKDRRHRKRRRRKAVRMDERFAGNINVPRPNKALTHNDVYKAWLINALLVASWYAFSLSISIVSKDEEPQHKPTLLADQFNSTTNGCFRRNIWISIFLCSLLASICSSNSV